MKARTLKTLAAAVAVLIIVLLLIMPKQPSSTKREVASVNSDPLHQKVDKAVGMVKGENPMEGIMLLREVLEEDSTYVPAIYWLGMFSVESGQLDKAQERFEQVVQLNPEYVDAYWQLGHLALERAEYYEAIDHFKRVLKLSPEEYNGAHFFLGKTYATVGQPEDAVTSFKNYKKLVTDTVIEKRVDDFIDELENNLNK
ncbi:tetratricopeptide repeat protein [Halocola ammonii]